ncbi:hypothetical protein LUZ60_018713 [Juncus effusus]|nr:hypothetical protein LUZ60_018374 [Juncus effusus]KAJ3668110.1 hypothetical protein LUZ60_018830 [Juncus effusus]KAJ3668233.1 hypothetical protein LUZ60_018676 [Juncus effusus]KAJ3668501.1 hypothetical protein LUZ60_018173 [Juncus effusus]KAJ3668611.1 hypothetical protein LUZ60_018713 [Juncus effusus]
MASSPSVTGDELQSAIRTEDGFLELAHPRGIADMIATFVPSIVARNHAPPVSAFLRCSRRHSSLSRRFTACQALVRFFALHRIKPHAPPLVRAPVNSFEFHSCERTPQAGYLTR